jgi:hypothetical protein
MRTLLSKYAHFEILTFVALHFGLQAFQLIAFG